MRVNRFATMAAAGVLAVGVVGCTSVGVVGYPAEYISMKAPNDIWVTTSQNPNYSELRSPSLHGDTLAGFDANGTYVEMPISDVKLMKAKYISTTKTAIFAGTAAIGSAALLVAVTGTNGPANVCFVPATSTGIPSPCGEYGAR